MTDTNLLCAEPADWQLALPSEQPAAVLAEGSEVLCGCEDKTLAFIAVTVALQSRHDSSPLIVPYTPLEEIRFALQGDLLHPVEGVHDMVQLAAAQGQQKSICHKLDVLRHEFGIHAHQRNAEGLTSVLLLQLNSLCNDFMNSSLGQLVCKLTVDQAGEIGVEALISGDKLIGEGQPWHEAALLKPEYGTEAAREVDALHACESHETLCKAAVGTNPFDGPLCLYMHEQQLAFASKIVKCWGCSQAEEAGTWAVMAIQCRSKAEAALKTAPGRPFTFNA